MRAALALVALLVAGCVSDQQKRGAIDDVNEEFRTEYERILAQNGTRAYKARREQTFGALRTALTRLSMQIGDQSPDIGYLNVYAPAPTPLTAEEWQQAAANDLPKLRQIAAKHVGLIAHFVNFEPEGLEIVINATTLERRNGTEVSLTMRMREIAPPKSGMPRREYAPPTAVRMGLQKIWIELERELRASRL
jgi:hypothetical protein